MRYFTYIAEQAFQTDENGQLLYFPAGPMSRPYLLPDEETERRVFRKVVLNLRIVLGTIILGQPVLFLVLPQIMQKSIWFVGYAGAVAFLAWIIGKRMIGRELKNLSRRGGPVRRGSNMRQPAARHSRGALAAGFAGSLAFVVGGSWMVSKGSNPAAAWLGIIFFGVCAVLWGILLVMKLGDSSPGSQE